MHFRKSLTSAALVAVLQWAAHSPAAAQSRNDEEFPVSAFPAKTFDNLSGTLDIYDTSGGAHSEARGETIFKRFTDMTSVAVRPDFSSDATKFFAAMQSGNSPPWSLIDLSGPADFNRAKNAGYLEKLDRSLVPLDKLEADAVDDYGIKAMNYGILMIWNKDTFPDSGPHPQSWADFYDVKKFPGHRCMFRFPQTGATLESALLADGVPADKLYPLDVDRALKKIETIKDHIVWWTSGSQAIQFMTNGECDIGINWSARIANAINYDEAPLGVTWNQGLFNTAYWAIPKGAANVKAGQAAIAMWILDRKGQIDYVTRWPQPTDIKGLSLDDYPEKVKPYLPVGDNLKTAIREDAAYYEQNLPALIERFNAWLQQ